MHNSIRAACLGALVLVGCGGPAGPPSADQSEDTALIQVGELTRFYQISTKKPPGSFADLRSVNSLAGGGYEAVRTGKIVLLYNAALPDTNEDPGEGPSDTVLAYQAKVPQEGGKVLMLNRTVKTMTADEFKAAKKAGKG